jgi:hypothetical protein
MIEGASFEVLTKEAVDLSFARRAPYRTVRFFASFG